MENQEFFKARGLIRSQLDSEIINFLQSDSFEEMEIIGSSILNVEKNNSNFSDLTYCFTLTKLNNVKNVELSLTSEDLKFFNNAPKSFDKKIDATSGKITTSFDLSLIINISMYLRYDKSTNSFVIADVKSKLGSVKSLFFNNANIKNASDDYLLNSLNECNERFKDVLSKIMLEHIENSTSKIKHKSFEVEFLPMMDDKTKAEVDYIRKYIARVFCPKVEEFKSQIDNCLKKVRPIKKRTEEFENIENVKTLSEINDFLKCNMEIIVKDFSKIEQQIKQNMDLSFSGYSKNSIINYLNEIRFAQINKICTVIDFYEDTLKQYSVEDMEEVSSKKIDGISSSLQELHFNLFCLGKIFNSFLQ